MEATRGPRRQRTPSRLPETPIPKGRRRHGQRSALQRLVLQRHHAPNLRTGTCGVLNTKRAIYGCKASRRWRLPITSLRTVGIVWDLICTCGCDRGSRLGLWSVPWLSGAAIAFSSRGFVDDVGGYAFHRNVVGTLTQSVSVLRYQVATAAGESKGKRRMLPQRMGGTGVGCT